MKLLLGFILSLVIACTSKLNTSVVYTASKDPRISALHYTLAHGLTLPEDTIIIIDEIDVLPEKPMSIITRLNYQLTQEHYTLSTRLLHKDSEICHTRWDVYQTPFESSNEIYLERFIDDYHADKLLQKIQYWISHCKKKLNQAT